jgi:hypothetical protein
MKSRLADPSQKRGRRGGIRSIRYYTCLDINLKSIDRGGGGAAASLATPTHPGVALFARSSRSHFWIAARSLQPSLSLVGETQAIMAAIAETMRARGWRFESVTKATTHYVGSSAAQDLHDNMSVRNAYYRRPGPASTGLPVAAFPFSPSRIAVDVLGVIE